MSDGEEVLHHIRSGDHGLPMPFLREDARRFQEMERARARRSTAEARATSALPSSPGAVIGRVRDEIRTRHYSPRTEMAYVGWIRRFLIASPGRGLDDLGVADIVRFLTDLATRQRVSASTQNQAFSALLFLFGRSWAASSRDSTASRGASDRLACPWSSRGPRSAGSWSAWRAPRT